jgi:ABC-type glycerol-3-phosphate transport system substrate-binding protein
MRPLLLALIVGTVALAACGGAASAPAANAPAASLTTATATPVATTTVTTTVSSGAAKASANSATAAQLQAAFEAAGVPNASRWVTEVQEYRPYPTNDPTFAKLKSNLAKYNPSADTLSRILAALSLP